MKFKGVNIITSQNEDFRLCQSFNGKYTVQDLENIVGIIYNNRNISSDDVLKILQEKYKNVNMDTIDYVMIWLKQVFTFRGLQEKISPLEDKK